MICRIGKSRLLIVPAMAGEMEAMRLVINMRDPQAFAPRIFLGKATGEEGPRRLDAIELQREFGTLIPHAVHISDARRAGPFEPRPERRQNGWNTRHLDGARSEVSVFACANIST